MHNIKSSPQEAAADTRDRTNDRLEKMSSGVPLQQANLNLQTANSRIQSQVDNRHQNHANDRFAALDARRNGNVAYGQGASNSRGQIGGD